MEQYCVDCKYSNNNPGKEPCRSCYYNDGKFSNFEPKESENMNKVTIEYKERPIENIRVDGSHGRSIHNYINNGELCVGFMKDRILDGIKLDKQTAIEWVQALNELVKQL